jgi:2-methylisocitrate lyase-like PEP mutase family enzyme
MGKLLTAKQKDPGQLRRLLEGPEPVLAPGAYDAFSARLVENAGFSAVYMTGFGTAAARLGRPDVGLATMDEMVDNAGAIASAIEVPLVADADTGYGNAINVIRTVQEFEQAGVAAIHLEDQIWPKKCGHMDRKQVVSPDDMAEKVHAATKARSSSDFLVIARTDARACEDFEQALARARAYKDAGADVLFVEALLTEEEIATAASELAGMPLVFNWVEAGKTPPMELGRLKELGYKLVIFPITTLLAAMQGIRNALASVRQNGTPAAMQDTLPDFGEVVEFLGASEIQKLEAAFATEKRPS